MQYCNFSIKNKNGEVTENLKLSKLCFGSLCIGSLQSNLSIENGAAVIARAFELGVNFIDTAQLYKTYGYIKRAFDLFEKSSQNKDADKRIVVSTKTYAYTKRQAEEALDEALSELGRSCIDIFLLHEQESIHTLNGHADALEYLFEMKEKGRIKAVGISTHNISGVLGAVEWNRDKSKAHNKLDIIHPIYNMNALGICDGGATPEIRLSEMEAALKEAKEAGIFVFAMKVLGGGNLFANAGKALDFVLDKPFIDSVAVGMKSLTEVEANVSYFEKRKFSHDYYAGDIGSKRLYIENWCTACGKCAEICPSDALSIKERAVCDGSKCVLCGYCSSVCKDFAIKII